MAYSFQGIGTMYIGKRDFATDKSYVTTEWFTLFCVPIYPLRSLRVIETGHKNELFKQEEYYRVIYERKPVLKQVLCIYSFAIYYLFHLFFSLWLVIGILLPESSSTIRTFPVLILAIIPYVVPVTLRHRAKKHLVHNRRLK